MSGGAAPAVVLQQVSKSFGEKPILRDVSFQVRAGEAIIVSRGEWVRYSTPVEGAEYIAICLPAFSPATVHRDAK